MSHLKDKILDTEVGLAIDGGYDDMYPKPDTVPVRIRKSGYTKGNSDVTRHRILLVACDLVTKVGLGNIRRDTIARRAGVGMGTVSLHFGDMQGLRYAIMVHAVDTERLEIIAMGLANGDPVAIKAPKALRVKALQTLL